MNQGLLFRLYSMRERENVRKVGSFSRHGGSLVLGLDAPISQDVVSTYPCDDKPMASRAASMPSLA